MRRLLVMLLAFAALSACASAPRPAPLTTAEIVQMSQRKIADDIIIERIRASGAVYRLSAAELVKLHDQGVSDAVLNAMQNTQLEEVRGYAGRTGVFGGVWGGSRGGGVGVGVGF